MNCKEVILRISEFIDGELDTPLMREIELHLIHCEDCRMVFDQVKMTVRIFSTSEYVDFPAETRERLHQALRQKFSGAGPPAV